MCDADAEVEGQDGDSIEKDQEVSESEGAPEVLRGGNHFRLVWIVAQLLVHLFLSCHFGVFNARVNHCVPNEGANPLRDHVGHKVELFANLETSRVGLLHERSLRDFHLPLTVVDLHIKVVRVERPHKGQDVQENGLSVTIEHYLLLSHHELRVDEILIRRDLEIFLGQ